MVKIIEKIGKFLRDFLFEEPDDKAPLYDDPGLERPIQPELKNRIEADKKNEEEAFQKRLAEYASRNKVQEKQPQESNEIFSDVNESLIHTEQKTCIADSEILTEIPKEELELIEQEILAQRKLMTSQNSVSNVKPVDERTNSLHFDNSVSQEVFPKKCPNCPEHKSYLEGEIHQCPDCGEWICGRHYQGHIMKNHKSKDYTISGSEGGSASIRVNK